MRNSYYLVLVLALGLAGCQSTRMGGLNPFFRPELTSFQTPAKRITEIRQVAERSTGEDTAEQREMVQGLVSILASEDDPLVREATLTAAAEFQTPLVGRALQAGLKDDDPNVRQTCCRLLGQRPGAESTQALLAVVQGDESFDVRAAAGRALGEAGADPQQLLSLLEDPDPAMQLVGVEAMQKTTGRDLGGDVTAYRALARGETPQVGQDETRVANRLPDWVPFF